MTATPETDNLARGNHVVPTEFAQDLERRLAELEKRFREKCMNEARLQCQIDERWGMRRELEAALGVTAGMENDESLRVGLAAIKQLQNERDEARQAFAIATDQCVAAQSALREARDTVLELRKHRAWLQKLATSHPSPATSP